MEVRRPPGTKTRVDPVTYDLGICDDLVGEPEERDVSEFIEEIVGDRPSMALPFLGLHGLSPRLIGLVDKLVLVVMVRSLAIVKRPDMLLRRPPRDNVGPDAALDRLLAKHLPHLGPIEHLDLRLDADILIIYTQRLGDLRPFRLPGLGERQDFELELPGAVAGFFQELFGLRRIVS